MATKGISLVKRLCHELPDIAGCVCIIMVSWVGLGVYYKTYDHELNIQHRFTYTVIRDEDAKPETLRKGCYN
uniref:Uncharacterized protein n=1 Tax=Arion vulgaris TaxID=1028688 RepID=A0A0B6ZSX8_9EUPU